MVELASKKFVCIVDESKLVDGLGGSKGEPQRMGLINITTLHCVGLRHPCPW